MMRVSITALALSFFAVVNAAIFNVTVGANNTLTYQPSFVTAKQGDVIVFRFVSKNHTVTQSNFTEPCTSNRGHDSGFYPANSTSHPTHRFTVTSSSSVWFFCAQTNHCGNGMVFALNPTSDRTFDQFQANAMAKGQNPSSTSSIPSGTSSIPSGTSSIPPTPSGSEGAAMRLDQANLGILTAATTFLFGLVL